MSVLHEICNRHSKWVRMAQKFDYDNAEDLVQEMYLKIHALNPTEVNDYYIYRTIKSIFVDDYKKKKFLILAAIGSFSGFTQSLKNFGVQIDQVLQFPDHHKYTIDDIALIFDIVKKHVLDGVITTQKDWTKLSFLIGKDEKKLMVFVFRIAFEFLTSDEELSFKNILELSNYIG